MVKVYEWLDDQGSKHLLKTNRKNELKQYKGLFVDELLERCLVLKTSEGTEIELSGTNWKVYEVAE